MKSLPHTTPLKLLMSRKLVLDREKSQRCSVETQIGQTAEGAPPGRYNCTPFWTHRSNKLRMMALLPGKIFPIFSWPIGRWNGGRLRAWILKVGFGRWWTTRNKFLFCSFLFDFLSCEQRHWQRLRRCELALRNHRPHYWRKDRQPTNRDKSELARALLWVLDLIRQLKSCKAVGFSEESRGWGGHLCDFMQIWRDIEVPSIKLTAKQMDGRWWAKIEVCGHFIQKLKVVWFIFPLWSLGSSTGR